MERRLIRKTKFASIIAITCLPIALFAIPASAQTATLYVATNGKDSNPGTLAQSLATIQAAAYKATPGTRVIVRGGVYTGNVWIGTSGSPSAYIRYYPYDGEWVIIDGTGTPSGTDLVGIGGNYVEFRGFEVRGAASAESMRGLAITSESSTTSSMTVTARGYIQEAIRPGNLIVTSFKEIRFTATA